MVQQLDKDWMTVREAAAYLSVCAQTVRRLVILGKLHGTKMGSGPNCVIRISAASIEKMLEKGKH